MERIWQSLEYWQPIGIEYTWKRDIFYIYIGERNNNKYIYIWNSFFSFILSFSLKRPTFIFFFFAQILLQNWTSLHNSCFFSSGLLLPIVCVYNINYYYHIIFAHTNFSIYNFDISIYLRAYVYLWESIGQNSQLVNKNGQFGNSTITGTSSSTQFYYMLGEFFIMIIIIMTLCILLLLLLLATLIYYTHAVTLCWCMLYTHIQWKLDKLKTEAARRNNNNNNNNIDEW